MALSYARQQAKRQAEQKRKRAEKAAKISAAHKAVDGLLKLALRDADFTQPERKQLSIAARALDSVAGGFCNDRYRR